MVVVLGPILVLLLAGAHDGLTLWLGEEYAARSGLALQILAVGVLANAVAHVPFGLLQSMGRPDLPAKLHLIELPVQLGAAWILVSRFGITGAALAWTGRMLLDAALLFLVAARTGVLRRHSLFADRLPTALAVLAAAGSAAILAAAFLAPAARIGAACALAAAAGVVLWRLAVPEADRRRLAGLLRP